MNVLSRLNGIGSIARVICGAGSILACQVLLHAQNSEQEGAVYELNPFSVDSSGDVGYRATNTISATNLNTPLVDLPVGTSVITRELLDDIQPMDSQYALQYNSSTTVQNRAVVQPRLGANFIRGFRTRNYLTNGIKSSERVPSYLIDRIEIVKGPNTLYGQADPGGLINVITKRPLGFDRVVVHQEYASWNDYKIEADINTTLAEDTVAVRLMGAFRDRDKWIQIGEETERFFGTSVDWHITEKTKFDISTSRSEKTGPPGSRGSNAVYDRAIGPGLFRTGFVSNELIPRDFSAAGVNAEFSLNDEYLSSSIRHKFNENFSLQYRFGSSGQDMEQYDFVYNTVEPRQSEDDPRILRRNLRGIAVNNRTRTHTVNGLGTIQMGELKHQILAGVHYLHDKQFNVAHFASGPAWLNSDAASRYPNTQIFINLEDPSDLANLRENSILPPRFEVNNVAPARGGKSRHESTTTYLSDMVKAMDDRLNLLLGIRKTQVFSRPGTNVNGVPDYSPLAFDGDNTDYQAGAVFKITDDLRVFGNYSTGFIVRTIVNADTGEIFPPETGKSYEAGLKLDLNDSKVVGTLSYFDVTRNDILRQVFNSDTLQAEVELSGEERSQGVEAEIYYQPNQNWQTVFSYTYLDARVVDEQLLVGGELLDVSGRRLQAAPPHSLSVWNSYLFREGSFEGLKIGVGLIWKDGPINIFPTYSNRLVFEDGYTLADLSIRYKTRLFEKDVTYGLNVNNLTDENYIWADGQRGVPRRVVGSLRFEF